MPDTTTPTVIPAVGESVHVSFFDGNHVVHSATAHVLAIGQVDDTTKLPALTVVYPNPSATDRVLASALWYTGFIRDAGVLPISDARVQSGEVSVGWSKHHNANPDTSSVPKPEGDADNPIFSRAYDPEVKTVSVLQAIQNEKAEAAAIPDTAQAPASETASTTDANTTTTETASKDATSDSTTESTTATTETAQTVSETAATAS